MAWMRTRITLKKVYKKSDRKLIAKDIIDFIFDRSSEKSQDKKGQRFIGYSKNYKKNGPVDLLVSGELLTSIEHISDNKDSILIGHDKSDSKLNGKAEGNIKGTYGQKKPVNKGRDYLGISQNQLNKILRKYNEKK